MFLFVLSLLVQSSTAELQSQWTNSLGFHIVATCTGRNPTPCPLGFGCKYGICSPMTSNVSTCLTCNYSGGDQPQCTVKCPPNTRLSLECGVWSSTDRICSSMMGNGGCVKAEIQTCDQEPLKCIETPCTKNTKYTKNTKNTKNTLLVATTATTATTSNCPTKTLINPPGDYTCQENCNCVLNYTAAGDIQGRIQIKIELHAKAEINLVSRAGPVQRQSWAIQSAGRTNVNCFSDGSCAWFRFLGEGIAVNCQGEYSCLAAECEGASSSIVSCSAGYHHCAGTKGCGNWSSY